MPGHMNARCWHKANISIQKMKNDDLMYTVC
ncbi:Uncharacterised protein [Salmonella enterica subsp. enterica serovar Infantis]|nr:Uncharacterised protein [Salmonella enterica subsp. enterica serovar Infantis]